MSSKILPQGKEVNEEIQQISKQANIDGEKVMASVKSIYYLVYESPDY